MNFYFYFPNFIHLNFVFAKLQDVSQYQSFLEVRQWKRRLSCVRTISCYQSSYLSLVTVAFQMSFSRLLSDVSYELHGFCFVLPRRQKCAAIVYEVLIR